MMMAVWQIFSMSPSKWLERSIERPGRAESVRSTSSIAGAAVSVESRRGFVEDQELGIVHQGGRQLQPLLHARGILFQRAVSRLLQFQIGQYLMGSALGFPLAHAVQLAREG
jgi:hypothetical protein